MNENLSGMALFVGDVSFDTTLLVDHLPEPDEKVHTKHIVEDVGGVVTNAAIACTRWGSKTRLHCVVGDDAAGESVLVAARGYGLDVKEVRRSGQTCRAVILLDRSGEKRLVLVPGAAMYPSVDTVETIDLTGVDWIHTAAYGGHATLRLLNNARIKGIRFSLDLEPATLPATADELGELVAGAQVVFVNDRSQERLGVDGLQILRDNVAEIVRTRGPAGASVSNRSGEWQVSAPRPDQVLDTTGAGDALAGVYIARRRAGAEPIAALRTAVEVASASVGGLGAAASYPFPVIPV